MQERLISTLLALCMVLSLLLVMAGAEDADFVIEDGILVKYIGPGGDVVIPSSVTYISWYAFSNCIELTGVTIPNSVTAIGEFAFKGCFGLTSITIPNSVRSIRTGAFRDCSGLTSIDIPNGVTWIGAIAFLNCSSLTSVYISQSVSEIGEGAFQHCPKLKDIYYAGNEQDWLNMGMDFVKDIPIDFDIEWGKTGLEDKMNCAPSSRQ